MEYIRQLNPFYKMMSVTVIIFLISGIFSAFAENGNNESVTAYSQKGSQGSEVEAVQQTLKDRGLFNAESRDTSEKRQKKQFSDSRNSRGLRRRELPIMQR